ncbi:MAG: ABC transporter substrate-binding protein, partial [Candidatus Kariarchaeaceae archaeon]
MSLNIFVVQAQEETSSEEANLPEPVFEFTFLSPYSSSSREYYYLSLVESFPKVGIGINFEKTDFHSMSQRAWKYEAADGTTYPIPLFDDGGFDALSVGLSGGLGYDPTGTFHTGSHNPTGLNMFDYGNATTDAQIEAFATETDFAARDLAAKAFQETLRFDLPALTIYYTVNLQVARTDMGWDDTDVLWKVQGYDGLLWANITGGADDEFSWAHPYGLNELDPITTTQYMSAVTQLPIFPGLYNRDPTSIPLGLWKPALAAEPMAWDAAGLEGTVKLREDVTFSNGEGMTAADVKNTFEWILTDNTGTKNKGDIVPYLASNDSIVVVDDYTVKFIFEEPYFDPESILAYGTIMPLSVIGNVT